LKLEFLTRVECNPPVGGTRGDKASTAVSAAQRGDKVAILRQVLLEGQAVSKVCEEHDVSPTLFYAWQKQFFENGAAAFAKEASTEQRDLERQVEALRQRLTQKDRVIAKVTEEFVKTKKELGEL
jgi:transposase